MFLFSGIFKRWGYLSERKKKFEAHPRKEKADDGDIGLAFFNRCKHFYFDTLQQ